MPHQPSPAAVDLVATALGRALQDIVTSGGPLAPMSVHSVPGGIDIRRFAAGRLEDALTAAREELADGDGDWVLVWDGYLTIDDWRTDALYGHLELADESRAHLFAWRYGSDEVGGGVGPLGAVQYLGEDARYADPGRSHPLPPGEGPFAPHGQVLPARRRWFRRR